MSTAGEGTGAGARGQGPHDTGLLSLQEAADRLKVHYMTAYRWVRQGELPASKAGGRLRLRAADVEAFLEQRSVDVARPSTVAGRTDWDLHLERLLGHLLRGDGGEAAALVRKVMADGAPAGDVYLRLLTPALHRTGECWAREEITVAEEHRATEICRAIVARLGDRFRRRGPRIGTVVTLTPPGEPHGIACAMVADFLRGGGFEVHHLGTDVPVGDLRVFLEVAGAGAVCMSVTSPGIDPGTLRAVVDAARDGGAAVTVVGGQGVTAAGAAEAGAVHVGDLREVVRVVEGALRANRAG